MLERAAKCIQSRGRPCFPRSKGVQTRRMLHSAFWHHGAADLDLQIWCSWKIHSLFEPAHGDQKATSSGDNRTTFLDRTTLDFLYPEKTQALIRRISLLGRRQYHRSKRRFIVDNPFRAYASTTTRDHVETASERHARHSAKASPALAQDENDTASLNSRSQLENLIASSRIKKDAKTSDQAWTLYALIKPEHRTVGLTQGLIHVLASAPGQLCARRAIRLFKSLAESDIWPSTYMNAVVSLLRIEKLGKAVQVHEASLKTVGVDLSRSGTDILLARLFNLGESQLVYTVWDNCLKSPSFQDNAAAAEHWKTSLFRKMSSTSRYFHHLHSFLSKLSEYPDLLEGESSDESFLQCLVAWNFDNQTKFTPRQCKDILVLLQSVGLALPKYFQAACETTLRAENFPLRFKRRYALEIYRLFRDQKPFEPTHKLLHDLIKSAVDDQDREALQELMADWYRLFGTPNITVTSIAMKGFAQQGDVSAVESMLSQYLNKNEKKSLKLLNPLLHVHAVRSDPTGVRNQMQRLETEFGLVPDIICWNTLLHAYEGSDDLDGAQKCFAEIQSAGLKPDDYTFGTMMSIAARRGDIDLVEQLRSMAESVEVRRTPAMTDALVLAYLNDRQFRAAENLALSASQDLKDKRDAVRTWNQILAHYSVENSTSNLDDVKRIVRTMRRLAVPLDAFSYSAIMRAFTKRRNVSQARKVMTKYMTPGNQTCRAIHYAILMDGYANEMQFERGFRMHAEMLHNNIEPTTSSRMALLKLQTLAARHNYTVDQNKHPGVRLDLLEETLEDILADPSTSFASQEPRLYSRRFSPAESQTTAIYDILITISGKRRAYDLVKKLLERYLHQSKPDSGGTIKLPLRVIGTLMDIHDRERKPELVEQYWNLAKDAAYNAAKVAEPSRSGWLPQAHRNILARHLDIYLRSLQAHHPPERMSEAINSLFELGFDLDNLNWNLYVQLLVLSGRIVEAFTICEQNLMQYWTGWQYIPYHKEKTLQATRQKTEGLEFMGSREKTSLAPGQLHVTYKTMLRFCKAYREILKFAFSNKEKRRLLDQIRERAPMTTAAASSPPDVLHPTNSAILGRPQWEKRKKHLGLAPEMKLGEKRVCGMPRAPAHV